VTVWKCQTASATSGVDVPHRYSFAWITLGLSPSDDFTKIVTLQNI